MFTLKLPTLTRCVRKQRWPTTAAVFAVAVAVVVAVAVEAEWLIHLLSFFLKSAKSRKNFKKPETFARVFFFFLILILLTNSVDTFGQCFFKKWANPGFFFVYFCSFQANNTFFSTMWKMSCPSSIQRQDSNSKPLKHESSPITTRSGLLPTASFWLMWFFSSTKKKCRLQQDSNLDRRKWKRAHWPPIRPNLWLMWSKCIVKLFMEEI